MLIASSTTKEGRRLLVLGLERENIDLLLNDQPVYKRLGGGEGSDVVPIPGLEDWDVTILGPEDTVRFVAHVQVERDHDT